MNNIVIDTYKDGDEIGINNLFNSVFNQNRDLREWEWKFRKCPIDAKPFIILAKDKNKIVGQYASVSYYLKYQDIVVKMTQPVDTIVHEDYRGGVKGVLVKMFLKSEETWRDNGIDVSFGFPNREHHIFGKRLLKYNDLIEMETLFKRLSWRLALKKRMNMPLLIDLAGWMSRFITRVSIAIKKKQ